MADTYEQREVERLAKNALCVPLQEASVSGDTLRIDFWYPPRAGDPPDETRPSKLELGLMSVRAADAILIAYDFARDGYSIQQASRFSWSMEEYDRVHPGMGTEATGDRR